MNVFKALTISLLFSLNAWADSPSTFVCQQLFFQSEDIIVRFKDVAEMFRNLYGPNDHPDVLLSDMKTIHPVKAHPLFVLPNIVRDSTTQLEEISTELYAARVLRRYQEQILFLPNFNGTSVPGFDGVIYDKEGYPIANYSLKAAVREGEHWKPLLDVAIEKAAVYSGDEMKWFSGMMDISENSRVIMNRNLFMRRFNDIIQLMAIYHVHLTKCENCYTRPTRVVIHSTRVLSDTLTLSDQRQIQAIIKANSRTIESVTMLYSDLALEFFENRREVHRPYAPLIARPE